MKRFLELVEQEKKKNYDIRFVDNKGAENPARAYFMGYVEIDDFYIKTPKVDYPEERMIVVLFHELGHLDEYKVHLLTNEQRNLTNNMAISEEWAFRNSLEKVRELFINGEEEPLRFAMKKIIERKNSGAEPREYQIALDNLVGSILWKQCESMVK